MDTHHPYRFNPSDFERFSEQTYDPNRFARIHTKAMTDITSGSYRADLSQDDRAYLRDAYDASIRNVDRQLRRLADAITFDRTRLVITSDHSEELWERDYFGHAARPEKPRTMQLHEEMLHVPLSVCGPDTTTGRTTTPVSLLDLVPTLLRDAGIGTDHLRGTPLHRFFTSGGSGDRKPVVGHATSPGDPEAFYGNDNAHWIGTVVDGWDKYIHYESGHTELFDLSSDPDERDDIVRQGQSTAEQLREHLLPTITPRQNDAVDTDTVNESVETRLQELGYLN